MKTVTAALSRGDEPFILTPVEMDEPRPDEILVRIVAAGICHTDLVWKTMAGDGAALFGHEGAGIVEKVGAEIHDVRPGDHVVLSYLSCGSCGSCDAAAPAYCENFSTLNVSGVRADGTTAIHHNGGAVRAHFFGQSSFATHAIAGRRNTVIIDPSVDLAIAAPLGCGVQTGAGTVINVLKPGPTDSLAVFGVGGVGTAAIMAAKALGVAHIIAIDVAKERLESIAQFGATAVLDARSPDLLEQIQQISGGGVTHALDTTAVPAVISTAVEALAPRGTLALVGLGASSAPIPTLNLISGGKTVRGSIEGDSDPQVLIPQLLNWYREGRFPLNNLITRFDFADINDAVAAAATGRSIKPVLLVNVDDSNTEEIR